MLKRINFTDRARINREHVMIRLLQIPGRPPAFEADLKLDSYGFEGNAKVFVEAARQMKFVRFEHGTAALPVRASSAPPMELSEFIPADGVKFCIKVVSVGDRPGVLLAEADQIYARNDINNSEDLEPLLPVVPEDLGHELWRIGFEGAGGPQLQINSGVSDWKKLASSGNFQALVYPAAMREVLTHILVIEEVEGEEASGWQANWLKFADSLPDLGTRPPIEEKQDIEEWISSASKAFARRHGLLGMFNSAEKQEDSI